MRQTEVISSKISPQRLTDLETQSLFELEVDSVVLYKELTKLAGLSGSIARRLREYHQLVSEQELMNCSTQLE